jgi:Zn-dependent alcohol dehydrogenase
MKAVVLPAAGAPLVIEDIPVPAPRTGEVLTACATPTFTS